MSEEKEVIKFFQYIDTALFSEGGKLMFVAITSSAQGALDIEGWQYGQGKSHLMAFLMRETVYRAYNPPEYVYNKFRGSPELNKWKSQVQGEFTRRDAEELIKKSFGYDLGDVRTCLKTGRTLTLPTWGQDDWQIAAGKHMSYDKGIRKLAGILSASRPYVRVFFTTQPDLGTLAKCMRELIMFELKVPERGSVEIQQIKTFTDFRNPEFPYKRLQPLVRGQLDIAGFPKLSKEMGDWYNDWRDKNFNKALDEWVDGYLDEEPKREQVPESDKSRRGRELVEMRWGRKIDDDITIKV